MNVTKCFDLLFKCTESLDAVGHAVVSWSSSRKGTVISPIQILQKTVTRKSTGMHKIFDKLYFDIITNKQKKYNLKSGRL